MSNSPDEKQKLYEAAIEADKRDYCASAIVLFERHLQMCPDHGFARFRYAQNLLGVGRVSDAETQLSLVTGIPTGKEWLLDLLRGQIEMERGNYKKAELHFETAVKRHPRSTVPWTYLAGAVARQERFKDACEILERALNAAGDLDEVYLNLGNNCRALGDYTVARQRFLRALEFTGERYKEAEEALMDLDFLSAYSKSE